MTNLPPLRPLNNLIIEWREQAITLREEADRIRRTVKAATDAEERCNVRAEIYDKCADSLDALLRVSGPREEQKNTHGAGLIHQTIPDVAETEPRPTLDRLVAVAESAIEMLRDRAEPYEDEDVVAVAAETLTILHERITAKFTPALNTGTAMEMMILVSEATRELRAELTSPAPVGEDQ